MICYVGDYVCILFCDKRWGAFGSVMNGLCIKVVKVFLEWIE